MKKWYLVYLIAIFIAAAICTAYAEKRVAVSPLLPSLAVKRTLRDGCNLITGDRSVWLTDSRTDCESLFIALNFDDRTNLSRLLTSLNYTGFSAHEIEDKNNKLGIYYKSGDVTENFTSTEKKFSSRQCESIDFFRVRLFCFNGVTTEDVSKGNDLKYIIPYFTVLKYTSNTSFYNPLLDQTTTAYDFILSKKNIYFDATNPSLYGETFDHMGCRPSTEEGPAACTGGIENRIYVCAAMLTNAQPAIKGGEVNGKESTQQKYIEYAGILYHEVNHFFDALSHNERLGHITCERDTPPHDGDRDWKSVYGAHINYLFSMSQNDILSCGERNFAYDKARQEMQMHLCQSPRTPTAGATRPTCE